MTERIKFPNMYNSGRGRSFCKNSNCEFCDNCYLAFNATRGGREMRVDFNLCNLNCRLCWSDNNAPDVEITPSELHARMLHCIAQMEPFLEEKKKTEVIRDESAFQTRGLQIIGGEPLLTSSRFDFIVALLGLLDESFKAESKYISGTKKGFVVKIFTNGVSIGNGAISRDQLMQLTRFEHLDIRILLSLKGLYTEGAVALQDHVLDKDFFKSQVNALNVLLSLPSAALRVEPVLGFYHSCDFNIQAPGISPQSILNFRKNDPVSMELKALLNRHVEANGQFYVEPVHAAKQTVLGKKEFLQAHPDYLSTEDLIEPTLKNGTKTKYQVTKLKFSL